MASLVDIGGWILMSDFPSSAYARYGNELPTGTYNLTTTSQKLAWILQSSETGSVSRIGIHVQTLTTSQGLTMRLESVGSDGNPTGTLLNAGSTGAVSSLSTTTPTFVTLDTACPVTKGQVIAVVVAYTSTAGDIRIEWTGRYVQTAFPYLREYNGSAWIKHEGTACVFIELSYGNRLVTNNVAGIHTDGVGNVNEGTLSSSKITMPFTCRIIGLAAAVIMEGQTGPSDLNLITDMEILVLNLSDTVLTSTRMFGATYRPGSRGPLLLYFQTPIILTADTTYRCAIKLYDHSESDPGVTLQGYKSGPDPSVALDFSPFRKNCILSENTAGTWLEQDYSRTSIYPIIDQVGV